MYIFTGSKRCKLAYVISYVLAVRHQYDEIWSGVTRLASASALCLKVPHACICALAGTGQHARVLVLAVNV